MWEPGLAGTTAGSPIRIKTGRSGVCGEIQLREFIYQKVYGKKREGAKGNLNLHRVDGWGSLLEVMLGVSLQM